MAELYDILKPENKYWDRKNYPNNPQGYYKALENSSTVYVGNLSFYTQQSSIKELFSRAGNVKDIIMGIDQQGTPCGFCFVIYETKKQAQLAVQYISKTRLGGRIIRVDLDAGYIAGREKGRGEKGQQKRDDYRTRDDPQRPRKKVATNYQSSGRQSYRDRGNSYRGGYRDRGDSYRGDSYRGRDDSQRDDYRGERRDYRQRQNRGYGEERGQRREYRQNREQRQNKQYRPQNETQGNKQAEY